MDGGLFHGAYAGQEILLLQSGMGAEKASAAPKSFTPKLEPARRPSSPAQPGFRWRLNPELRVGDLILCQNWSATMSFMLPCLASQTGVCLLWLNRHAG